MIFLSLLTAFFLITSRTLPALLSLALLTAMALVSRRQALRDPLTGLRNPRALRRMRFLYRFCRNLTLIYFDIDGLKQVNDLHGHQNGDVLIKNTAFWIQKCPFCTGFAYRLGGDEFLLVATRIDLNSFLSWHRGTDLPVSLGLSTGPGVSFGILLQEAERNLYDFRRENRK